MLGAKPAILIIMKPTKLFLTCEHATNNVPDSYLDLFNKNKEVLATHRAIDFGAIEIANQIASTFNCELTKAEVTRLLIDCNRSLNNANCFSEFSNELSVIDKEQLANSYYRPYREKIENLIKSHITNGHQVLHISCHSFTPVFNGIKRNAGIGLLYDPKHHGEKEVAREWQRVLSEQTDYRVRVNYPYSGKSDGFTTYLRKKFAEKDYLGIELEINQDLVKDKSSIATIANEISNSLSELLELI